MFMIRKILKANLKNLDPTDDIILSITDTNEIYYNNKQGIQFKLNDVTIIDTENELTDINPVSGRLYYVSDIQDLKIYINPKIKFVSITKQITDSISNMNKKITSNETNISNISKKIDNNKQEVDSSILEINKTLANNQQSINSIQENLTSTKEYVDDLKTTLPKKFKEYDDNIAEIQTNIETNTTNITNIQKRLKEHLEAYSEFKSNTSNKLNDLQSSLNTAQTNIGQLQISMNNANTNITTLTNAFTTQRFNHSIPIRGSISGNVYDKEFSIYDHVIGDNTVSLGCIKIKSKLVYNNNITVKLFYLQEYEDNSIGQEELICSLNLITGSYTNSFIIQDTRTFNNGYFRVNITNPENEELDLIVLLELTKTLTI